MNSKLSIANYIISIAVNNVTDEIREGYKTVFSIDDINHCKMAFRTILETVLKSVSMNKYNSEVGIAIVENEYTKLDLKTFLGEYTTYSSLVYLLVDTSNKQYINSQLINLYKHWIDIADNLSNELKIYVYHSVLNALVKNNLVAEDLDFSEKVTIFVSSNNIEYEDQLLFNIINTVLINA